MLYAMKFVAVFAIVTYLTWVFFLAVMMLRQARDAKKIPGATMPVAYLVLGMGLVIDWFLNMLATVLFVELPAEWLLTGRLSRHIRAGAGWRYRVARWFCDGYLNPFDPGHCH